MKFSNVARRIGHLVSQSIPGLRSRRKAVARPLSSRAVAEHLSGVVGSSMIWCGCGELLAPIVYSDGTQAEVVSLVCIHGHGAVPVAVGVLVEGPAIGD
jgi:hypothetical protein